MQPHGDEIIVDRKGLEFVEPDYKVAFGELARLVTAAWASGDRGYLKRANEFVEVFQNSPRYIKTSVK
jgi:hypothetical protein